MIELITVESWKFNDEKSERKSTISAGGDMEIKIPAVTASGEILVK